MWLKRYMKVEARIRTVEATLGWLKWYHGSLLSCNRYWTISYLHITIIVKCVYTGCPRMISHVKDFFLISISIFNVLMPHMLLAIAWIWVFRSRMFLAKVYTGESVKPVIYLISYFLTLLTLVYNQGILAHNPFPCIFKACMNLILIPMDRYWSSLTIDRSMSKSVKRLPNYDVICHVRS